MGFWPPQAFSAVARIGRSRFWRSIRAALYNHFLLAQDQHDRIDVVLVSPRNPLNIGAAARAMANFGFSRLTVVAPYAPHWREARSAIGAPELLHNAKETESLAEAVTDCTLVIGTGTLTYRKPEQCVVPLPGLAAPVEREMRRCGQVALVFGPEKHGLTRVDLSHCHLFVEIPTDVHQPSMNLGQAVAVCLYELAARGFPIEDGTEAHARPIAAKASDRRTAISNDLELLAGIVEQVMEAAKYSPAAMKEANRHDLRLLLRRLAPTEKDSRRILGLFRRILWRLKR